MIKVTVELISAVHESRNRLLGTALICNVGGTETKGEYDAEFFGGSGGSGKSGHVSDYPRKAISICNLLRRSIEAAGYTK